MNGLTQRAAGMVMVVASTAFFALAGVFTKAIAADAWTVACWRGLFGALLIGAYVLWRRQPGQSLRLGARGWTIAVVVAISSVVFVSSFKHTAVANVAVVYATAPFATAALAWLLFRERSPLRTMLAACVSLCGVVIMVAGGLDAGRLTGDLLAALMTLLGALQIVLVRSWRHVPTVWAGAASAVLVFLAAFLVVDPLAASVRDIGLCFLFGCSFSAAVILLTEGAMRLPPAETGLLGAAEVPFTAVFGWLFLREWPPTASFVGGGLVLAALLGYAAYDLWRMRRLEAPQT